MKKLLVCLMACLLVPFMFSSCQKDEEVSFDESLLIGKWVTGSTVYYKYLSDHTGGTWDTADDVTEAEAQPFTWKLEKDQLTQIHQMVMRKSNGRIKRTTVPKVYTITELTATSLKYKDSFGNSTSFTKVSK